MVDPRHQLTMGDSLADLLHHETGYMEDFRVRFVCSDLGLRSLLPELRVARGRDSFFISEESQDLQ